MSYSAHQLRDFSYIFSRSNATRWLKGDFSYFDALLERHNMLKRYKSKSYYKVLRDTYKVLKTHYPNEYLLKNEFLNKWLINQLGNCDSKIFSEFRIGNAIADLAMFNGSSKAFEIKTILDNDSRLKNQLNQYKKIFNEVYLIIPSECLDKYIDYDKDVGVISYDCKLGSFALIVKATNDISIDVNVLMQVLRTKEYLWIVNQHCDVVPSMNAFNQFEISKEIISGIPSEKLNALFLDVIKKRNSTESFLKNKYKFLNQLSLSLNMDEKEIETMIMQLETQTL